MLQALPSCTVAGQGGQVWGAPGRTSPPGFLPSSGCDRPPTGTAQWPGLTPPLSHPNAAPPPAGRGNVTQHDAGAPGTRYAPRCRAQRACL